MRALCAWKYLAVLSLVFPQVGCGQDPVDQEVNPEATIVEALVIENPCVDETGRLTEAEGWTRCGYVAEVREGGLQRSDLDLRGIRIERAGLVRGRFERSIFDRATLTDVRLPLSNLRETRVRGARLARVMLADADLGNADLRGSTLLGVNLQHTNLKGADLRGVIFDRETVWGWAVYDQTTCLPFSDEEARWRGLRKQVSENTQARDCSEQYQITE